MAEDLEQFVGKWKLDRSENVEEFFKAMGMNFFLRKMASRASPEQIVTREDNKLKIVIHTAFMTREDEVKLNEEYEKHDEKMGAKFKCKARMEEGKLIVDQERIDGDGTTPPQIITREIIEGETVVIVKVGDVISKRWFKRLE
ncbi:myelin P2 protein-like [Liolophura sinensis]|uniref:myelin P2 protein-like n=1 Tax=Liolophura sinensis TaxID=3198878 RepID=UPI0031593957